MTRKLLFLFLLIGATLLAACSPATPVAPTATAPAAPQPTQGPTATQDPNAMACRVTSLSPTQSPELNSKFPPPDAKDWSLGNSKDPILTVLEYSDFECPYCAQLAPTLAELVKKYPDQVRVIFRHFPLPSHTLSLAASSAAEAAGAQGKFWEMYDQIFAQQSTWVAMTADQFNTWLADQAQQMGLDKDQFVNDMKSKAIVDKVTQARQHGLDAQIPGTPFVLLNGQIYQGPRDLQSFESILNLYQLEDRQYSACPPMIINPQKQYTATVKTEKGDIVIDLYPDKAPLAVNSFVFLAQKGWFDNVTFHRVLSGYIAQTGDPSGSGFGGPGYSFDDEISDLKFDKPGVLGMANAGPGSNGSQFFITMQAIPDLDGQYTIFGQVIQGLDVVQKLTPRDPAKDGSLPPGDKILSVNIQEKE